MFTFISWQQYLLAVIILVTAYYAVILFSYYRVEIVAIFNLNKDKQTNTEPILHNKESILGEIHQDNYETSISPEELQFSSETPSQLTERNR